MTTIVSVPVPDPVRPEELPWPDHTQLPDKDGVPVKNSLEHLQSLVLTDSLQPVLQQRHPDGDYFIGQDCGIYWKRPDPRPHVVSPDWFFVPNVPALLRGRARRSYVLWDEVENPAVLLEFASEGGSEERDRTPVTGKFWIYEHGIRPTYYGIFFPFTGQLEVYRCVPDERTLRPYPENERNRYPILGLGVELGLWTGRIDNVDTTWLRWWDAQGQLLPTGWEQAEHERQQAEHERQRAEHERQRAEHERQRAEQEQLRSQTAEERAQRFAERLRAMGVDPDQV